MSAGFPGSGSAWQHPVLMELCGHFPAQTLFLQSPTLRVWWQRDLASLTAFPYSDNSTASPQYLCHPLWSELSIRKSSALLPAQLLPAATGGCCTADGGGTWSWCKKQERCPGGICYQPVLVEVGEQWEICALSGDTQTPVEYKPKLIL